MRACTACFYIYTVRTFTWSTFLFLPLSPLFLVRNACPITLQSLCKVLTVEVLFPSTARKQLYSRAPPIMSLSKNNCPSSTVARAADCPTISRRLVISWLDSSVRCVRDFAGLWVGWLQIANYYIVASWPRRYDSDLNPVRGCWWTDDYSPTSY